MAARNRPERNGSRQAWQQAAPCRRRPRSSTDSHGDEREQARFDGVRIHAGSIGRCNVLMGSFRRRICGNADLKHPTPQFRWSEILNGPCIEASQEGDKCIGRWPVARRWMLLPVGTDIRGSRHGGQESTGRTLRYRGVAVEGVKIDHPGLRRGITRGLRDDRAEQRNRTRHRSYEGRRQARSELAQGRPG
uniref:Uncharacterized protein n=1 Tax=Ralstonia solanacearum TaxID=305 RepID=A0A0S4U539_RALSL|nr:protein of unknown function [Ralstonia solanacearum]